MTPEEILNSEAFQQCAKFHGHVCPGLAIGFKAAQTLMARLGVTRAPDEELVAIVETDACGADAIQVMTGCTLGKGNLILESYGKHAFSLGDRKRGKMFRACLRPEAILSDPEHLALYEKIRKGESEAEEMKSLEQLRERRLEAILRADPDALFMVKEIIAGIPQKARIVESVVCNQCGELTMVDLLQEIGDQKVCIPCAKKILNGKKGSSKI
ncbi:MAG: formylmethanofuran dehydrogenase [Syntrophaceae bacterium]|nr:formylmethanofuran dehydrogenase [Syntrophaceae bacterium]